MTEPTMLAAVTSWLTPASLFLLLNVVIGTIAVSSRFTSNRKQSHHHHHHHQQPGSYDSSPPLARAPSLIDRVKSINFSLNKFPNPNPEQDEGTRFFQSGEPVSDTYRFEQEPLARAPSLIDRVKSINFAGFKFPNPYTEQEEANQYKQHNEPVYDTNRFEPEPPKLARAPSLIDRVKSINFSGFKFTSPHSEQYDATQFHQPSEPVHDANRVEYNPPKLARAPSLIERVKYFTSVYRDPKNETDIFDNFETEPKQGRNPGSASGQKPKRSKSETKKSATKNVKKSASEKSIKVDTTEELEEIEQRRPQTVRLEKTVSIGDGDLSVDAKADDFINRFKKQLKLQRLDSLLRYKEMLNHN